MIFFFSIIFTVQNYYEKSQHGKTIMKNVHYQVFFYNRVQLIELSKISSQIMPGVSNFMYSNFQFLMKTFPENKFHYILVDGHTHSKMAQMHIRTHIFPDKNGDIKPIIFYPNQTIKKSNQ
jgi:hypothetical protein